MSVPLAATLRGEFRNRTEGIATLPVALKYSATPAFSNKRLAAFPRMSRLGTGHRSTVHSVQSNHILGTEHVDTRSLQLPGLVVRLPRRLDLSANNHQLRPGNLPPPAPRHLPFLTLAAPHALTSSSAHPLGLQVTVDSASATTGTSSYRFRVSRLEAVPPGLTESRMAGMPGCPPAPARGTAEGGMFVRPLNTEYRLRTCGHRQHGSASVARRPAEPHYPPRPPPAR